jgi:hypothetical protein
MLSVDEAVEVFGIRTADVIRLAESEKIHSRETTAGHLLVCSRTLSELLLSQRSDLRSEQKISEAKN